MIKRHIEINIVMLVNKQRGKKEVERNETATANLNKNILLSFFHTANLTIAYLTKQLQKGSIEPKERFASFSRSLRLAGSLSQVQFRYNFDISADIDKVFLGVSPK